MSLSVAHRFPQGLEVEAWGTRRGGVGCRPLTDSGVMSVHLPGLNDLDAYTREPARGWPGG